MQNVHVTYVHIIKCARCARSRARELHGKFKFYVGKHEFFYLLPHPPSSPPASYSPSSDVHLAARFC